MPIFFLIESQLLWYIKNFNTSSYMLVLYSPDDHLPLNFFCFNHGNILSNFEVFSSQLSQYYLVCFSVFSFRIRMAFLPSYGLYFILVLCLNIIENITIIKHDPNNKNNGTYLGLREVSSFHISFTLLIFFFSVFW